MNARQTREQERAKSAWENVARVSARQGKEYGSLARSLSAMIQTNGLGQTLAFLKAKAGNNQDAPHALLCDHLSGWVYKQLTRNEGTDLLKWIITQNSDAYRRATVEALAYAIWLRRFSEAQGWGEGVPEGGGNGPTG